MFFINNMKRLIKIFLSLAAICLVISGISAKSLFAVSVHKTARIQSSDTINANALLKINRFRLDIIPPSSGVQFYRDGIVFLSNSRLEGKMLESHTSFGTGEAYFAALKDTVVGNHTIFSNSGSWDVPADAMTFSSDYSVMYYTKLPSSREKEKIYQAKYQISKNGKHDWVSDSKPLGFCTDKSVYSNPALSADGEKMIFVSDRKESIGGLDLFISYKEGSGWSAPINLGNLINTSGNEMYPFLDQENNLYFSSDGIKGFGGYDIFLCRYNGRGWDKPINLTQRINTPGDDIAFTLSRLDGRSAFYTTRIKTGNRTPQLYMVSFRDQYAINKMTNLSNAFKYLAQAGFTPEEPAVQEEAKKAEPEKAAKEPVAEVVKPVKEPVAETAKPQQQTEIKPEPVKPPVEEPAVAGDTIIYRVQFASTGKPKGSYEITAGGKKYKTFEYLFNGAYRSCAGDFTVPGQATNLQNQMKREGFPDAFVVAFRNNERLTGSLQSIIKSQEQPGQKALPVTAQVQKPAEIQQETVKPPVEEEALPVDAVIYRIQFTSNAKPKGSYEITSGGKTYRTFEYLYNGAYRSCAGAFTSRSSATALQNSLKREGFPDAFVVAFKNNERITDPSLLK
jgi:hypothetical protein